MGILISRRNFLKASALLVPALATMPMVFRRTAAASNLESSRTQSSTSGRTLLVVQMAGGNDGLNTIVPYSDGRYYDLRGPVSIPESDVLHLNDEVGFHPSLAEFKKFWDEYNEQKICKGSFLVSPYANILEDKYMMPLVEEKFNFNRDVVEKIRNSHPRYLKF